MSNLTTFLAVLVMFLVVIVPIVGSLTICVPKWWRDVSWRFTRVPLYDKIDWHKNRWYLAPIRWAYMPFIAVIALSVVVFLNYMSAVFAFIEKKCPYTASWEDEWRYKAAVSDTTTIKEVSQSLWDFTCGRK